MNTDTLELVKPKFNLVGAQTTAQLVDYIVKKLQGIDNLATMKTDPEIIKYICNLVENVFYDNKALKLDKKQIVFQILRKVIPILTDDDVLSIGKTIEFLHSNKLIKKISKSKTLTYKALRFFSLK